MLRKTDDSSLIKRAANTHCIQFVKDGLKRVQLQIIELEQALTSETKSSAGDKHETGRAMIQLEREKLGHQLSELEKTKQLLSRVPLGRNTQIVGLGSLVKADICFYYIAIAAGGFNHGGMPVYCISAATPIGQLIMGKSVGCVFHFNGNNTTIRSIH